MRTNKFSISRLRGVHVSSNINEVIRTILNLFIILFFTRRFHTHKKRKKKNKKRKKRKKKHKKNKNYKAQKAEKAEKKRKKRKKARKM